VRPGPIATVVASLLAAAACGGQTVSSGQTSSEARDTDASTGVPSTPDLPPALDAGTGRPALRCADVEAQCPEAVGNCVGDWASAGMCVRDQDQLWSCGPYRALSRREAKGGSFWYFDERTGGLVAAVFESRFAQDGIPAGPSTCVAALPGFTQPNGCSLETPSCPSSAPPPLADASVDAASD
jgi:hypothetical protein